MTKLGKKVGKEQGLHCYSLSLKLPKPLFKLNSFISDKDLKLILVGGAVRSPLLGQPTADYDCLLIGMNIDTVAELLKGGGYIPQVKGCNITVKVNDVSIDLTCVAH